MKTLTNGLCAQLACILEATARKPGNVHRFADFDDATYLDFLLSAAAIAGPMGGSDDVGVTVLKSVEATRRLVNTNTNLGMILLLAPLTVARREASNVGALRDRLRRVLASLTVDDARQVYTAIRLAQPGGLGETVEQDVADEPTVTLLDAMRLAADRDSVARQYANDFADVFDVALPALRSAIFEGRSTESAIIHAYLTVLSRIPDTLIARKLGNEMAAEASRRAVDVLSGAESVESFDAWLRADGRRRNPGTTADLTTAALFVSLADGTIQVPEARNFTILDPKP